jgi:phage terminase large subunit-like protein
VAAADGWLLTTPGNAIDYDTIKAQILADAQMFQLEEVAVDRLFQGYQLSMQLADEGLTVAACGMGYMSMAGPCKEFERRLLEKQLHHGGHPVLKWMANNVAVREDPAGNLKPDKASSQGKIDGIIGILLALDRAMRHTTTTSVYESRGLLTLGGSTDGETPGAEGRTDV